MSIPLASRSRVEPSAVTVIDRDAGLFDLDADLYPQSGMAIRTVIDALVTSDGGRFALRAVEPRAEAPRELLRLDAKGVVIGRLSDLPIDSIARGTQPDEVQWLEPLGATRRWMSWSPPDDPQELAARWCWTALDAEWAGDALGGVWRREDDELQRIAELRGSIETLQRLEDGLGVVTVRQRRRAIRFDSVLRVRCDFPIGAAELVIWLEREALCCDADRARLSWVNASGRRVRVREEAEVLGVTGGIEFEGDVLLNSPGALLRFDARGRRLPGQGGFRQLVGKPLYSRPTSSAAAANVLPSFSALPSISSGLIRSTSSSSSASCSNPPPGTASKSSAR